jgi:hypothetical protein
VILEFRRCVETKEYYLKLEIPLAAERKGYSMARVGNIIVRGGSTADFVGVLRVALVVDILLEETVYVVSCSHGQTYAPADVVELPALHYVSNEMPAAG